MIYLDNAATSYPKPQIVYDEVLRCMEEYCANPGRGGHKMSIEAGNAVFEAREEIADLFNIDDPMQVCFTKNATEALNIGIKGTLKSNNHVIITGMEHNSVLRPLKMLERKIGINISIIKGNSFGEIDINDFNKLINKDTKLIVSTLSSNVNGIIMPIKEMGEFAKKNGIMLLVDASQGAGSIPIDIKEMDIDMLAFPGHKGLLGPQGVGGIYIRKGIEVDSIIEGGTGSNSKEVYPLKILPEYLESGTLNTPGIVGLRFGIRYIKKCGIKNIMKHKYNLTRKLYEGISELKGTKIYSKNNIKNNSGIVAMNFIRSDSTDISYLLDKNYNIATRAGIHCSPLAHKTLETLKTGIVRFSVGYFNKEEDIDLTLDALREISYKL